MKFILILTLIVATNSLPNPKVHPLSNEFIDIINNKNTTWKAGRNFHVDSISQLRGLYGALKSENRTLPTFVHEVNGRVILPDIFDARDYWPSCPSIGQIRDQASCASCWAFGAVEAMTDRICIHSDGVKQVSVSAEDLMSCCGASCGVGCYGGFPDSAWAYWANTGIVTGGEYGTNEGCKPYSLPPCSHYYGLSSATDCSSAELSLTCTTTCNVPSLDYKSELTFGENVYYIPSDQEQIKLEIMTNGPVEAAFNIYEDFLTYKSGVYQQVEGEILGGHAIKILGWGVEKGTLYWLAANSWGKDWGSEGYFKILRGVNHVGIESDIVAGLPKL